MVTPQNEEVFRVFDFVGKKQTNGLQGLFASVNIIPKKKVVSFWWETTVLEESKEIVVLSVYVTTDLRLKIQSSVCTEH